MSSVKITRQKAFVRHEVDLSQPHWWEVTTGGQLPARRLGTHYGTLEEVARKLSAFCEWKLSFSWISPEEHAPEPRDTPSELRIEVKDTSPHQVKEALSSMGLDAQADPYYVTLKL